ncbi:protein archease isoform X7 [Antrostomus carolinensis]|uniref:protein archease isoform X7 n=1 Tax=Antrostomus carolinensis TaxID=279965 RepID=UPI0010A9938E|nr:protein archease isoform X7 [Antrostomus carolinensis]
MAADERDYNLTEEQKAVKAKYPPLNKKYECEFGSHSRCAVGRRVLFTQTPSEVKAITYSAMQICEDEKPEVFVIIDI